jgi:hypothetical protein
MRSAACSEQLCVPCITWAEVVASPAEPLREGRDDHDLPSAAV